MTISYKGGKSCYNNTVSSWGPDPITFFFPSEHLHKDSDF